MKRFGGKDVATAPLTKRLNSENSRVNWFERDIQCSVSDNRACHEGSGPILHLLIRI